MVLGDFNLDINKIAVQNYIHRHLYDELFEMVCAFDLNQIVNEITWSRIYDNQVRSSILDHVYVGDTTVIDWCQVLKQPISDHSAVVIKIVGIETSNRVGEITRLRKKKMLLQVRYIYY